MPPSTRTKTGPTPRRTTRQSAPPHEASDPESRYAPTSWGNGGTGGLEDITVPSGQMCQVRRCGVEGLIKAGVLKNVDSLTALVNEKHIKRVAGKETLDISTLDEAMFETIADTMDKVLAFAIVQPPVHRVPNDVTSRVPGAIYTDMIELLDKAFIFNFVVGGTRDLESFRNELSELLGGVVSGEGIPEAAQ